MKLSQTQQDIIDIVDSDAQLSNWRDWRWQIAHSVRSLDDIEKLLNMSLNPEKRVELKKTIEKFPETGQFFISVMTDLK